MTLKRLLNPFFTALCLLGVSWTTYQFNLLSAVLSAPDSIKVVEVLSDWVNTEPELVLYELEGRKLQIEQLLQVIEQDVKLAYEISLLNLFVFLSLLILRLLRLLRKSKN